MDILKQEIERKRKLLQEKQLLQPAKKYFKRSELVQKEKEEYYEKYGGEKPKEEKEEETKSGISCPVEDVIDKSALSRKEVIKRLRERGEPILLFGESEFDAFKRLRKCEILEPEPNKGFRNDFQEAMEKVDQAYLDELLKTQADDSADVDNRKKQEKPITYEEVQQMAVKLGRGDAKYDMDIIIHFLQLMIRLWGEELNKRSEAEKITTKGKMALATYTQTQQYLKPLLNKLKNKTLPEDILDSLTEIVRHLLDRNYIMASDAYLQMAIGNAPWPIGVTMVGIHARTGREKIFSKNVAHVLNDETQRKYIQGLKRLMTKCQHLFPTDPSRCVEYTPTNS
ncbi:pre-mRNA-splicing factor 18 [Cimex lectularius]|uniref:Pre-mRNA-splicing factor 18 n=1 Tax=Cimex lectularius TaxID=79782 RepID=A0A8I6R6E2_CIMLE|nr:pre-mRNA-splicing factor 18 [Cimex lectularius]